MSTIKESTHQKNVANFDHLISVLISLGPAYNPGNTSINITPLQSALTSGQNAIDTEKTAKANWKDLTNTKEIVFSPLSELSTRILHTLESCNVPLPTVHDCRFYVRKIHGIRAKKIKPAENENPEQNSNDPQDQTPVKHISVSQRSYDSLIEHFQRIIVLLSSQPQYATNEPELKISALQTLLTNMKTARSNAYTAKAIFDNARIERNKILYDLSTGILTLARLVKAFIKGKYGINSPEFKLVSAIKFVRIVKRT